jgi:23S rRNA (guanosine2251-2'-O)-methyltransferase
MAGNTGNSSRRGAVRKTGTKKGQTVGSGGNRRQKLEGKGPTPKAEDRPGHKAYQAKKRTEKAAEAPARGKGAPAAKGGTARRGSTATELVVGRNSVVEALREKVPAVALYVAHNMDLDDRVRESVKLAGDQGLALVDASRIELDRLTDGALHQGLALKVPPYRYAHVDDLLERAAGAGVPALVVALDSITDPRNLGAIVRSAAAFGAHGVLIPERRSASMTAAAWKTSAGAAARVPVAQTTNLARSLRSLAAEGCFVVGLAADGTTDVGELDPDLAAGPLVLVVGAEGAGLSRLVAEACDLLVSIPMTATTESLNAGVAAGIAMYAIASHRG